MIAPYPQARLDITGTTPDEAHGNILQHARAVAVSVAGSVPIGPFTDDVRHALDALCAGLVSILERHAPADFGRGRRNIVCAACSGPHQGDHTVIWPCQDYLDASAGYASGLQEI